MAINPTLPHGGTHIPISEQELILRNERREISLLLANEDLSLTYGSCAAGERIAGPHIHHQHSDAFYVLEGELTFEIGRESEAVTIGAGSLVAAPPGVAHSLRNAGPQRARWLTIHAADSGFANFLRGIRDGRPDRMGHRPDPAERRSTRRRRHHQPDIAGGTTALSRRDSDATKEKHHSHERVMALT